MNKLSVAGSTVLAKALTRQLITKPRRDAVVLSTVKAVAKTASPCRSGTSLRAPVIGGGLNEGVSGVLGLYLREEGDEPLPRGGPRGGLRKPTVERYPPRPTPPRDEDR